MRKILALQALHVPSVAALPPQAVAEKEEFEREGIKSLVAVPLIHRGSLRGYLGFDSVAREKAWTDENIQLLRMAGEIFVNALERKNVDLALTEAKAKYLNIFENAVEGIYQTTPEGRFLGVNPALARILGYADPREMTRLHRRHRRRPLRGSGAPRANSSASWKSAIASRSSNRRSGARTDP